jgi:hypothetical protein
MESFRPLEPLNLSGQAECSAARAAKASGRRDRIFQRPDELSLFTSLRRLIRPWRFSLALMDDLKRISIRVEDIGGIVSGIVFQARAW